MAGGSPLHLSQILPGLILEAILLLRSLYFLENNASYSWHLLFHEPKDFFILSVQA